MSPTCRVVYQGSSARRGQRRSACQCRRVWNSKRQSGTAIRLCNSPMLQCSAGLPAPHAKHEALLPPAHSAAPAKAGSAEVEAVAPAGPAASQDAQPDCQGLPSTWGWWAMRALSSQQRVLAGRAASLRAPLRALSLQARLSSASACRE